jgi:hypothetical protein
MGSAVKEYAQGDLDRSLTSLADLGAIRSERQQRALSERCRKCRDMVLRAESSRSLRVRILID